MGVGSRMCLIGQWEDAVELFILIASRYALNADLYEESHGTSSSSRLPLSTMDTHQVISVCLDSRYICAKSIEKAWKVYEVATNQLGHLVEESITRKLKQERKKLHQSTKSKRSARD